MERKFNTAKLFLVFVALSFFSAKSQELPRKEIRQVRFEMIPEEENLNTLISFNSYLVTTQQLRFRKEIKKAKKDQSLLNYYSQENWMNILKVEYLKKIKRAANRSKNHKEFLERISQYFPDWNEKFMDHLNFLSLYPVVRTFTFNGYIDSLPDVL